MNLKAGVLFSLAACSRPAPEEISLGKVQFKLANPSEFTDDEKRELFGNMEAAHSKLSQTLGADVMTMDSERTVMVNRTTKEYARGEVNYGELKFTFGTDLRPHLDGRLATPDLNLADLSEPNLVHEFTHLFAQGSIIWSELFTEGMVFGLTHHLYPNYYPSQKDFQVDVAAHPCVQRAFEKGWDTDMSDLGVGAGIKAPELEKLIKMKWMLLWDAYADQNPDFFKKFFEQMEAGRAQGKQEFSREEVWAMARSIDPQFDAWVGKNAPSFRSMDNQVHFFGVETAHDTVSIFNFGARARREKENSVDAALMGQMVRGKTLLHTPDPVHPVTPLPSQAFVEVSAPGLSSLPNYKITVEGRELPLLDEENCK